MNWAVCDGRLLSIVENDVLFQLIGTTYGGNGQTTFALPNLQDSAPLQAGQGPGLSLRDLGQSGGSSAVTLIESEIPAHKHAVFATSQGADQADPANNVWAQAVSDQGAFNYYNPSGGNAMDARAFMPAGGSLPHNNMHPYLALSFCIALQGVFPLMAINPASQTTLVFTVPAGTVIPSRAHFLVTNQTPGVGFSLGGYPSGVGTTVGVGDGSYTNLDINDGGGVALFSATAPLDATTRLDAVGFTSAPDALYREGAGLAPPGGLTADGQYSFARKLTTGVPQNTGDNAADFAFVAADAGTYSGVAAVRGAPGPESLASPVQRNATIKPSLIDPQQSSSAPPNRVRDATSGGAGTPTAFGTLEFRRKFTNSTGGAVSRLRFRVVDITATNTPGGPWADLRVLSSVDTTDTITGGVTVTILGTTVETPPAQAQGGGLNTSVVVTIPGGPLPAGQSVNVRFVVGVAQTGGFRFFVNTEGLP